MTVRSSTRVHQSVAWMAFVALLGAWGALAALTHAAAWTDLLPLAALFAAAYAVLCEQRVSQ